MLNSASDSITAAGRFSTKFSKILILKVIIVNEKQFSTVKNMFNSSMNRFDCIRIPIRLIRLRNLIF